MQGKVKTHEDKWMLLAHDELSVDKNAFYYDVTFKMLL